MCVLDPRTSMREHVSLLVGWLVYPSRKTADFDVFLHSCSCSSFHFHSAVHSFIQNVPAVPTCLRGGAEEKLVDQKSVTTCLRGCSEEKPVNRNCFLASATQSLSELRGICPAL